MALVVSVRSQNTATPCSFSGPPKEQARCLLRRVKAYAKVDPLPITLPEPLNRLIGEPTNSTVTRETLLHYLNSQGIRDDEIGGPLSANVSKNSAGQPAAYFIIHDTSYPRFAHRQPFPPAEMDTADWPGNRFDSYLRRQSCPQKKVNPRAVCEPVAHVFINRLGESQTGHDFSKAWGSTQYERRHPGSRGLFLAVENIQPRRNDRRDIDAEAPNPGFTDAQLDRLALVYVAASVRRGQWLILAFHAVIDLQVGSHDDPQNFDLNRWASRLDLLLNSISLSATQGD